MGVVDITKVDPNDITSSPGDAPPRLDKDVTPKKTATKPPESTWAKFSRKSYENLSTVGGDIENTVTGAVDTLKTAATALGLPTQFSPDPQHREKQQQAASRLTEIFKAPGRALAGKPQPGQPPESAPTGLQRPLDAIDLVLGGDPGEARLRAAKGDTVGSISALATGPLLLHGLTKLAKDRPTPPTIGPKPKSSVPALRENIPPDASATMEKGMRVARPGQYLPNDYERVSKLTSVIGTSDKVNVPEALKTVLPELDKTAREYAIPPKGPVATEGITKRTGEGVKPSETLNSLMENTMGRLEKEYQDILRPVQSQPVFMDPIADRIAAQKTQGLIDLAAANPTGDAAKTVKYLNEAEAAFRGKSLPLRSLDDLRQYYYTAAKSGEAGRIAARSNEAVMADTAIESGMRDLIYTELERQARTQGKDPGFIRDLKNKQRNLYSLLDVGKAQSNAYINEAAVKNGYDALQKMNVTSAIHPGSLTPVMSVHGLVKGFAGDPKDLKQAEKRTQQAFAQKGVPVTKTGKTAKAVAGAAASTAVQAAKGAIPNREGQKREAPPTVKKKRQPPVAPKPEIAVVDPADINPDDIQPAPQ